MKIKLKFAMAMAAFGLAVGNLSAQSSTNGPSFSQGLGIIWDAATTATNWSGVVGGGHSLTGSKSIVFGDLAYNFTQNVGVVIGYDDLFAPKWAKPLANGQDNQANIVNGGVTLNATIHPFAFVGSTFLTNIVGQPFVTDLIAQPKGNNAIGNIITTGVNFDIVSFSNFELSAGAQYESRQGQGFWDGNYALAHLALTRTF